MSSAGVNTNAIIVVSGLPRSGTSMMMKMLQAGGVPLLTDAVRQADSDNPEGYFEFERAKQLDKGDSEWLAHAGGQAVKVISALLPHLPDTYSYQVVFMERDIGEVLASQRKMLAHRGVEQAGVADHKMAVVFQKHLDQVKSLLAQRQNISVLYLHYRDLIYNAPAQALRVSAFLDQPLNVDQMVAAVNKQLYRNRRE